MTSRNEQGRSAKSEIRPWASVDTSKRVEAERDWGKILFFGAVYSISAFVIYQIFSDSSAVPTKSAASLASPYSYDSYGAGGHSTTSKTLYLDNYRFKGDSPKAIQCEGEVGEVECHPAR